MKAEWLEGSIAFLEEGAAFLIKDEPAVLEEQPRGPCAWNECLMARKAGDEIRGR